MSTYKTVMLPNGKVVLAKVSESGAVICPMRYTNWTQARRKVEELGQAWGAWRGAGRTIYIVRILKDTPPVPKD